MPMMKKGKGGKKLVRAKSLKKVKPLSVNTYVTINGPGGTPQQPTDMPVIPKQPVVS